MKYFEDIRALAEVVRIMTFIERASKLKLIDGKGQVPTVEHIVSSWKKKQGLCVINYAYYASYVRMQSDEAFLDSMLLSDFILVDGIGMQLYFKILKGVWLENLNGTDLNPIFIDTFEQQNIPYAFYGTTAENIKECKNKIDGKYSKNHLYYIQDGFSPLDWSNIKEHSALIVGMGSPRQENWIKENQEILRAKKVMVISVGGFFDFLSGFYIRAPLWVRKIKLEWAWRTMLHPKRHLQKRLLDLTIMYLPLLDRFKGYHRKVTLRKIGQ